MGLVELEEEDDGDDLKIGGLLIFQVLSESGREEEKKEREEKEKKESEVKEKVTHLLFGGVVLGLTVCLGHLKSGIWRA